MSFQDHFSRQSDGYRRHRPAYPASLVEYVAARVPGRGLAVDCATGTGQAAVGLAPHFTAVLAVDASPSQLAHAEAHDRVHYAAGLAERLPVRDRSVDLVAAAQAAHWFDHERFHAECRRVLVPGGAVAVWCYEKFRAGPRVDDVIDDFFANVVGDDWPPERAHVAAGYRTLPFPWREERAPDFQIEVEWHLPQLMGYLATWSAVQRHRDRTGCDPLEALGPRLAALWPPSGAMPLAWPVHLRIGRA